MSLKKRFSRVVSIAVMLSTLMVPSLSYSGAGIAGGSLALKLFGGLSIALSPLAFQCSLLSFMSTSSPTEGSALLAAASVLAIGGGVMLDDQTHSSSIQFLPMDESKATELCLTEAQVTAYHSELKTINLITNEVSGTLAQNPELAPEEIHEIWSEVNQSLLSPEAVQAVEKISYFAARFSN